MSTTVTGSPPQGQVASHRRPPAGQAAPRPRRRFHLPPAALPVYTGYVEDGQIYNSLGHPAGGSFIQVALAGGRSDLLQATEQGSGPVQTLVVMAAGRGWGLTRRLAEYR
jgi:hypothetical protein